MKLIEGAIVDDDQDQRDDWRHYDIDQLRRELATARADADKSRRAMAELRRQLGPLYRALQVVFGALDAAGVEDSPASGRSSGEWDEWKSRLGPSCAKVIDALLLGGEMTVKAIMVSAKMGPNTVYQATSKMGQAGILVKNGGKFSLKVR